jgi:hypothetical protein
MGMPRSVCASAWVIAGLLFGGPHAHAKGLARKAKPSSALVEIEGQLLEYEESHPWCTYKPGVAIHGMGESPWGRFKVEVPTPYAGRSFGVLLKCNTRKELLQSLRLGAGHRFILVLPQDFLKGNYKEIEDCAIDSNAMKRWRLVETDSGAR